MNCRGFLSTCLVVTLLSVTISVNSKAISTELEVSQEYTDFEINILIIPPHDTIGIECSSSSFPRVGPFNYTEPGKLKIEFRGTGDGSGVATWMCWANWGEAIMFRWVEILPGLPVQQAFNIWGSNFVESLPRRNNTFVIDGNGRRRILEDGVAVDDHRMVWSGPKPPVPTSISVDSKAISTVPEVSQGRSYFEVNILIVPPHGTIQIECRSSSFPTVGPFNYTEPGKLKIEFSGEGDGSNIADWGCWTYWGDAMMYRWVDVIPGFPLPQGFNIWGASFVESMPRRNNTFVIDGNGRTRILEDGVAVHDHRMVWSGTKPPAPVTTARPANLL